MGSQLDEHYMQLALKLAEKAKGRTSPNPMVGAVIVRDGKVVGTGYHQKAGTPHAEIHALMEAGERAKGATMYVNLEPCSHHGRTGPCTDAIIEAGISKVVCSMIDPNPRVCGRGKKILEEHGIEVEVGILEREAQELNKFFIKYITTGKPYVIIKVAMSLDGKIATFTGESKWISSEESRLLVHKLRDEVDAILVGINTIINDDPSLTTRLPNCTGKDPIRIIADSKARIPLNAKVLHQSSNAKTIIAVTDQLSEDSVKHIRPYADIIFTKSKDGRVDLEDLMKKLGQMEITSVMIEGGAEINWSAIESGIVDEVMFFIAPKLVGGATAKGPIGGRGFQKIDESIKLRDVVVTRIGQDILIKGRI